MNLMSLMATLSLDSSEYRKGLLDSESEAKSVGDRIGSAMSAIGKAVAAVSAAGAAAVGKLAYDAVSSYANYEQLIGGVETLFKDSADIVSSYADNAYKTAGLSANEYMETVTSFSASLLQSLGGDTEKAAEYADMAITDMSDNANKMGTSMESIQFAYQGFAKQNYTMLDNLKLGYGGTKSEMERLIEDAEKLDTSFVALRDENGDLALSYSDVVDAIHIVQTQMGITGTTAKEAATTIEGSMNSMKASWKNLLTGLGTTNADIEGLVTNFTTSLETAARNILPVLERVFNSMSEALPSLVGNLLPKAVSMITNMLPKLLDAVTGLVSSIATELPNMVSGIVKVLPSIIQNIFTNIGTIAGNLLPALAESLVSVLANLPAMLAGMIGGIVNGITNLVTGIADSIKHQAEDSIPDDIAEGYVGKIESNFEKTFSDGWLNLKTAIAGIFGNTDWAEALNNIKLAQDLEDKIVADYNSAKENISQYSFENFQIETEAKINTAMGLIGALKGMINPDGTVSSEKIEVVQSFIDQINSILGEDAVKLEESPAEWIIKITEQYKDADGNITDPEALKNEIRQELNRILGGGEVDLNETTYNAVSRVLSTYTEAEAYNDKENIKTQIQTLLEQANVDPATAEIIANASVEEGALYTWYNNGISTAWDNSAFIERLQKEGKLPSVQKPAQADAIAEIITKLEMGELDETEFREELDKFQLTDEEKNQIITYSINEEALEQTIEDFKKIQAEMYRTKLMEAFTEAQIENTKNYTDALMLAKEAQEDYNRTTDPDNLQAFNASINDATLALNAQEEEARMTYDALYELLGGEEELGVTKENFIQQMVDENQMFQNQRDELASLRQEEAELVSQMVETAGGYANLSGASKTLVQDIIASTSTFGDAVTIMGLSAEQANVLKDGLGDLAGYYDYVASGVENSTENALDWLVANDEASILANQLGISVSDLAALLVALAENEDYLAEETKTASDATAEAAQTIATGVTEGVEGAESAVQESTLSEDVNGMLDGVDTNKPTEIIGDSVQAGVDAAKNNIIYSTDGVVSAVEDMESGMDSAISPISGAMAEYGDKGGSGLDSAIAAWKDPLSTTLSDMSNRFYTVFGVELPPAMGLWGYNAGSRFEANLALAGEDIYSTVMEISANVALAFAGLEGDMYSSGYYAGQGFYNGLSSWSSSIIQLAWDTANEVANATNSALGNASPSKKMRRAGSFAGEGLFLGLKEWEDAVTGEAETIANGITGAFDDDIGIGFDGLDDMSRTFEQTATNKAITNEQLYSLLQQYLPQLANMQVVMDGDKTVGALMPKIDRSMSNASAMSERGVTAYA